ncbi:unnamed protein product (macronuclear) [Paramecium tetraurelia]|uniref:Uncharacterized protein n=1 Tax=Paramecium tetraurelia TaxID=5888 RepID=A0DER6_PARTE|nr:uncharacterized protein GSPATT00016359001 [Paramecium tetraurelia]CAK81533.1 unnamed protein product [Paramecium tetraurelia]|eukprot:XP_001448930.1 hypothetical protein (macronuclear) [Paramecium tetraurelia strain d4-2]
MFVRLISRMAMPILRCQRFQFSPALTILNNRLIIHNLTQIRIPIMDELTESDQDEELQDGLSLTSA